MSAQLIKRLCLLVAVLFAVGCGDDGNITTTDTSGGADTSADNDASTDEDTGGADNADNPLCEGITTAMPQPTCSDNTSALIDDLEDGDGMITADGCRDGAWETYGDGTIQSGDVVISPNLGEDLVPADEGADGSTKSAHFHGDAITTDGYAGLTINLVNNLKDECGQPGVPYDASSYTGVRFMARGEIDGVGDLPVAFKINDVNTHADGGVCADGCYDAFTGYYTFTSEWQTFEIPFADLAQSGWGDPSPAGATDAATLFSINFQVSGTGGAFDMWVDNVEFY